jgi:hypothetical protein
MQLNPTSAGDSSPYARQAPADNDVVIVSSLRTPVCKAKRGGFKDTMADDLLSAVLIATMEQTGVEPQVCTLSCLSVPFGARLPLKLIEPQMLQGAY